MHKDVRRILDDTIQKASERTGAAYFEKVTELAEDGSRRIVEDPPVLVRLSQDRRALVLAGLEQYRKTVPVDVALLLTQYSLTDVVRRVVGVGSVGKRDYLLIVEDARHDPLLLQIKEADASVLCTHGRRARRMLGGEPEGDASEGRRVVENQRILQATSDPFLGYVTAEGRDYYVRQFRDKKVAVDPTKLSPRALERYGQACGVMLARAHVQSGKSTIMAGYLGAKSVFDEAIVRWSTAYAKQVLRDYERLRVRWAPS